MNDANNKIKQQIVEKIKSSANILITVSRNPSVDDLSAALGLAALLNKLDKHATAIFSGSIPPAITFLDPTKVFENNVDSLRDFIIALDKEKADHLRYKVEGDLVKIFITPYRTTITNEDLEFSHGDFNVDLVMALGVASKEDLDTAIEAHGNILQDVTVATLTAGTQTSQLGNLDWHEDNASSLSEMVANLGEAIKSEQPLLDQQIATALLTGIVSATDRFSNAKTSSKVMSVAAMLMGAGADQQLIAAKLQESHEINSLKYNTIISKNGEPIVANILPKVENKPADGSLSVQHTAPVIKPVIIAPKIEFPIIEPVVAPGIKPAEKPIVPIIPPIVEEPVKIVPIAIPEPAAQLPEPLISESLGNFPEQPITEIEPTTSTDDQSDKIILKHSYVSDNAAPKLNSIGTEKDIDSIDIFNDQPMADGVAPNTGEPNRMGQQAAMITPPSESMGIQPLVTSPIIDLPMPPPLPDFSTLPPLGTGLALGAIKIDHTPSAHSTLPPIGIESPSIVNDTSYQTAPDMSTLPTQAENNDPSQFRIPGQ